MMLRFTNATSGRHGDPIYLNKDWIISVYEQPTDGGSLKTIIFGGPGGGIPWTVEESLSEVIKIINEAKE